MSVISGTVGALLQSRATRSSAETLSEATTEAADVGVEAAQLAADAQLTATRESLDFQQGIFDVTREDLRPFREAGVGALTELAGLSAVGGEFSQQLAQPFEPFDEPFKFGTEEFEADPGFQFRLAEGERALNRAASARGGLVSGGQLRDLTEFSSGLASQEFGAAEARALNERNLNFNESLASFSLDRQGTLDRANLLSTLAGFGSIATGTGAAVGSNFATSGGNTIVEGGTVAGNAALNEGRILSDALINQGNIGAVSTVGQSNAITQGLSNIGSTATNLFLLNKLGFLGSGTTTGATAGLSTGHGGAGNFPSGFAAPIAASGGAA